MLRKKDDNIESVLYEDTKLPESLLGLEKHNNTHYFLLPLIEPNDFDSYRKNYVNSYIGDNGRDMNIDDAVMMLFSFKDLASDECHRVSSLVRKTPGFIFSYYAGMKGSENLVMFVFKCRYEHLLDFRKIRNGEYSKVSSVYLKKVEQFPYQNINRRGYVNKDNVNIVKFISDIVNRDSIFKTKMENYLGCTLDKEIWNGFEEKREIYRFKGA